MPWTVYSRREATSRAARALIEAPGRSDQMLADQAGVSTTTIGLIRARLESIGVIPHIPVHQRTARPRPQQPSAARDAIERLGPDATPRQVADAAGVSVQAAWRMLRKIQPQLQDAAAAAETFSVSKMPRMLDECAAAADVIHVEVSITCEVCTRVFRVSTADAQRRHNRFCSDSCRNADARERGHAFRPRTADPHHPHPVIRELPPLPEEIILGGLCVQPTLKPAHRYVWTSDDPEEREIARRYCRVCSVRMVCYGWSLSLPVTDAAIYAGMTQTQRLEAKRDAGLAEPPPRTG